TLAPGTIFGNDLRFDHEEFGFGGIDSDFYPMGVRITEHFETREVIDETVGLLAHERFADVENMHIAVNEQHRLFIGLHLRLNRREERIETAGRAVFWWVHARKEAEIAPFE